MRVNYGRQAVYRRHGCEPACGCCRFYGADPARNGDYQGRRFCPEKDWYVLAIEICNSFEREPGADDV